MTTYRANDGEIRSDKSYRDYLAREWELFEADKSRRTTALQITEGMEVNRVLDIGCGAGQELLPFIENGADGVGIDSHQEAGQVGREMFCGAGLSDKVDFVCASGASIPFKDGCFDIVICRVAIMYMDNRSAFGEIARVMQRPGKFLLKYHAPAFYWAKLADGLTKGDFRSSIHAARVLFAGYFYYLTGRQLFNPLTAGGEIFQTRRTLIREISGFGLKIEAELPDTNRQTPSLILARH